MCCVNFRARNKKSDEEKYISYPQWYQYMMMYMTAAAIVPSRLTAGIILLHVNTMGRVYEALLTRKGIDYKRIFVV